MYLCKDCIHNNHGWCKAIKRNKLKEIEKCDMKDDGSKKQVSDISIEAPAYIEEEKDMSFENQLLGKRMMLWYIQRQAMAIKENNNLGLDKFEALCHCLNSIEKVLSHEEVLFNIDSIIDTETDRLMIKDSKLIATRL